MRIRRTRSSRRSLPVSKLKRVFASILYVLAAYMLWKGLRG